MSIRPGTCACDAMRVLYFDHYSIQHQVIDTHFKIKTNLERTHEVGYYFKINLRNGKCFICKQYKSIKFSFMYQ